MQPPEARPATDQQIAESSSGFDFYLVAEATSTLFATSAFLVIFKIWRDGIESFSYYAVALSIPALASMALLGLGLTVPSLFAVRRVAFPLNLTLPLIHGALITMFMELMNSGLGLIRLPESLQGAMVWANPRMIVISVVAQFIVLSALTLLRIPPPKSPSPSVESH